MPLNILRFNNINFIKNFVIVKEMSVLIYNKQTTSWLVREYDFYSLVNYYKLTRLLVTIHSWIKIVRAYKTWSNLYIYDI
jgi:hypothetical protein